MRVLRDPRDLATGGRRVSVAIGVFDGVHLGHQQVIRQALSDAAQHAGQAVVITFDRHPAAVVAPDRAPRLIYPLRQKLRVLEVLGVSSTWLIEFDKTFSGRSAEAFVQEIVSGFAPLGSVCVGNEFVFGHGRRGNVELLRRLGEQRHFWVRGVASVSLDGEPISSTRIRDRIQAGDFDAAGQMLGRPYALSGVVEEGQHLGAKLGFPTANLCVSGLELPPNGVYAVWVAVDGRNRPGVANIGLRPTVDAASSDRKVEAHLIDFDGSLYGCELDVTFAERLRDEMRFPNVESLRERIGQDVVEARRVLGIDAK